MAQQLYGQTAVWQSWHVKLSCTSTVRPFCSTAVWLFSRVAMWLYIMNVVLWVFKSLSPQPTPQSNISLEKSGECPLTPPFKKKNWFGIGIGIGIGITWDFSAFFSFGETKMISVKPQAEVCGKFKEKNKLDNQNRTSKTSQNKQSATSKTRQTKW